MRALTLGVRVQSMFVVPWNGDRVKVEFLPQNTMLVRVPKSWGDEWLDHARDINDAVAESMVSVPEPGYCA